MPGIIKDTTATTQRRNNWADGVTDRMIRLFNVYYPTRTIVLLLCEG